MVFIAKKWAKKFYNSSKWQDCRAAYRSEKMGVCEKCGQPGNMVHHKILLTENNINDLEVTLSFDNLELLCKSCHDKEDGHWLHRKNIKELKVLEDDVKFDSNGDLIPNSPISQ